MLTRAADDDDDDEEDEDDEDDEVSLETTGSSVKFVDDNELFDIIDVTVVGVVVVWVAYIEW